MLEANPSPELNKAQSYDHQRPHPRMISSCTHVSSFAFELTLFNTAAKLIPPPPHRRAASFPPTRLFARRMYPGLFILAPRYKASLRGYGGLQKFLAGLRERQTSGRLDVSPDGSTVMLRPTVASIVPGDVQTPPARDVETRNGSDSAADALDVGLRVTSSIPDESTDSPPGGERQHLPFEAAVESSSSLSSTPGLSAPNCTVPTPPPISCGTSSGHAKPTTPSSYRFSGPLSSSPLDAQVWSEASISETRSGDVDDPKIENVGRRRLPEAGPITCESLDCIEMICGDIFQEPW